MLKRMFHQLVGNGLAARARRGAILTVLNVGGSNVLRLVSNLVLTRLLFPEAFGLMALVQVFTSGMQMFSDIGIRASIVQSARGDDPDFIRTAWTMQVIRGALLSLVALVLAPLAAMIYDEPMLALLLPVAGLNALIHGFRPSRVMTASRNLRIGSLTVLGLINQIVTLVVTVLLAWWLQSVWALVIGSLIGGIVGNTTVRIFIPGLPDRFTWEWTAVRELIGFGKFIFLSTLAAFLVNNVDRAILGKFIALDELGIYSIALVMASLPHLLARRLGNQIVFPLYSRRPPHESAANRSKLFRGRFILTGAIFAISLLLALGGDPLIKLLYDPRYHAAGGLLVLMSLGFLPSLITMSYPQILLASGRSDRYAALVMVEATLRISIVYFGVSRYGVSGAALAPALSTLLYYPVLVAMTRRYRAWDPVHDVIFALAAVLIVVVSWSLNADVILALGGG